jgi:tetratricopeptide (TPR) repeat protein
MRLIQVQERTNRLAEARDGLARLRRDPRSANLGLDMVLVEAQLAQREGRYEAACGLYRRLVDACVELHLRHHHLFPLAKCLDALQRHDEAFATLEEAHRSQVALLSLTAPDAVARRGPPMQITEFQCDPDDAARWEHSGAPSTAESPVFIVAFPRSGTTLLEQALDAHPMLQTMDEQPFLQNAVDDLIEQGVVYPEGLAAANEAQLAQARARYWALARRKVRLEPGQRLLDKNPLNLLRLPAMRRLFPNARIVLAIRHPCDVILSCFMQHFRAPEFALLCRDPVTLATGYRRAFDFWYLNLALLRPAVHEVRYESFVTDFAAQVRAVSEFLDLPWAEGMLAPAEHAQRKGFISTPSYAQVVQPVNGRAVGRWTAYRKHLSGVLPHVRPYLERWGYDG